MKGGTSGAEGGCATAAAVSWKRLSAACSTAVGASLAAILTAAAWLCEYCVYWHAAPLPADWLLHQSVELCAVQASLLQTR